MECAVVALATLAVGALAGVTVTLTVQKISFNKRQNTVHVENNDIGGDVVGGDKITK